MAASLSNLGLRLLELGRPADALVIAEEGVTIHRELTADNPDRYWSDLAQSLHNLSAILSALDRHPEAEQVRREAEILQTES